MSHRSKKSDPALWLLELAPRDQRELIQRYKNRDQPARFPPRQFISAGAVHTLRELHRIFNLPDYDAAVAY